MTLRPRPRLIHEYALQLPLYEEDGKTKVAAQSELLAIDDHRFLLLCRDSGGGLASKRPASLYRKVELADVQGATDVVGRYDDAAGSIAPNGILRGDITPAAMADFVDLNDNSQLGRFDCTTGRRQTPMIFTKSGKAWHWRPRSNRANIFCLLAAITISSPSMAGWPVKPMPTAAGPTSIP